MKKKKPRTFWIRIYGDTPVTRTVVSGFCTSMRFIIICTRILLFPRRRANAVVGKLSSKPFTRRRILIRRKAYTTGSRGMLLRHRRAGKTRNPRRSASRVSGRAFSRHRYNYSREISHKPTSRTSRTRSCFSRRHHMIMILIYICNSGISLAEYRRLTSSGKPASREWQFLNRYP